MRHGVCAVGMGLVVAFAVGCSREQPRSANDVFGTMKTELSHSLAQADAFDTMDDELAHAIGTTTLTSEALEVMPLPEGRMPLVEPPKPIQTWGVSPAPAAEEAAPDEAEDAELSATRE